MVLATITTSLANFLKLPESDLSLLEIMGEGDEQHNLEDDKAAATESVGEKSGTGTLSIASDQRVPLPTASSSRSQPKKKIPESWQDEDLGDGSSESGSEDLRRRSSESEDEDSEASEASEHSEHSEDSEDSEDGGHDRSVEELELGFKNIHKAFSRLRFEFDTKFRAIFA